MQLCVTGKGDNRDPILMKKCRSLWIYKLCLFSSYLKDTCTRVLTPEQTRTKNNNEEITELLIFSKQKTDEIQIVLTAVLYLNRELL